MNHITQLESRYNLYVRGRSGGRQFLCYWWIRLLRAIAHNASITVHRLGRCFALAKTHRPTLTSLTRKHMEGGRKRLRSISTRRFSKWLMVTGVWQPKSLITTAPSCIDVYLFLTINLCTRRSSRNEGLRWHTPKYQAISKPRPCSNTHDFAGWCPLFTNTD